MIFSFRELLKSFPLRLCGLLFGAVPISGSAAEANRVTPDMSMERLEFFSIMEEPTAGFGISDILSGESELEFLDQSSGLRPLGISDRAWWIRFDLSNPGSERVEAVVSYPFPMIDRVDFYQISDDGDLVGLWEEGEKRPRSKEFVAAEGYAVTVSIPAETTHTVYLRVENTLGDVIDSYVEVGGRLGFQRQQAWVQTLLGFIMGGGVIVLLYNLVLWAVVRERIYGWYVAYLFFALLTFAVVSGFWHTFVWIPEGHLSEALPPIFSSLTFLFLVQFSRHFLETREAAPRIDRILRVGMFLLLTPPVLFFAGHASLAATAAMLSSIGLNLMVVLALYLWRQGSRVALIYAVAWSVWLIAICALSGRALGWWPTNDFTLRIGWLGIWGEAVVFALALGVRIRLLQGEKMAAETESRQLLERSNTELESMVAIRTTELEEKREELEKLLREKDKFFSIIAHDLRNPFQSFYVLSEVLNEGIEDLSEEERRESIGNIYQSAGQLHRLLENLLAWALLQRGEIILHPEMINVRTILDECISLYEGAARHKNLKIQLQGRTDFSMSGDPDAIQTIIRNILNNAIKYSYQDGEIHIRAEEKGNGVEFRIEDFGLGMTTEAVAKLTSLGEKRSAPGTAGETGSGLGLQLCIELIKLHGGDLTVESMPEKGSRFRVFLANLSQK